MGDTSYRTVAEQLVARIRAGELPPHSRLPLDELEAEHGKAITAAAVAWLAAQRWVVRAPGMGARVSGAPPDLDAPVPATAPDADLAALLVRVEELERWRAEHERRHGEGRPSG
jgi:DNA-binding FadR family transcriptional regulator